VIEQNEFGEALVGGLEELGNSGRMQPDAVRQPGLEGGEVVPLQILGATGLGVVAAHIDRPEIVVPEGELPGDIIHRVAYETRHAVLVLLLHLLALGVRDAEQTQGKLAREGPVDPGRPQQRPDAGVVDVALVVQGMGSEQRGNACRQAGAYLQIGSERACDDSGQAVIIEAPAPEPVYPPIPEPPGAGRKLGAQGIEIERSKVRMVATAEDREEIVKLQAPDARELELQQGVLAWVGIHRMNAPGSG